MPSGKLRGKTPDKRKERWFKHFRDLLGIPDTSPPVDDIPIIHSNVSIADGAFTLLEFCEAKKQVRFGKAPGEDCIKPELLKASA